jgi:DNA-binding transcriptional MerR regulator
VEIGFAARQVVKLTGIPYSTLNLWAKNGLLQPSVSPGTGTGRERVYSFSDLIALKVAFKLRQAGVSTSSLKKVIEFLRENEGHNDPLATTRLVVSGSDVLVVTNNNQLISALSKPGQSCLSFVVDLPRTLGELAQIAESTGTFAAGFAPAERAPKRPPKKTLSTSRWKRA